MTCAQGLLRLLWGGGPKLECYGTDSEHSVNRLSDKDSSLTEFSTVCKFLGGNGIGTPGP